MMFISASHHAAFNGNAADFNDAVAVLGASRPVVSVSSVIRRLGEAMGDSS